MELKTLINAAQKLCKYKYLNSTFMECERRQNERSQNHPKLVGGNIKINDAKKAIKTHMLRLLGE